MKYYAIEFISRGKHRSDNRENVPGIRKREKLTWKFLPERDDICNERIHNRGTNCERCNDSGTQNARDCYELCVLRLSLGHNPAVVFA